MGYRRQEPPELEVAPEVPSVLPEIIRLHLEDMKYDLSDLCRLLHLNEDDLHKMHPLPGKPKGPTFRVIK